MCDKNICYVHAKRPPVSAYGACECCLNGSPFIHRSSETCGVQTGQK